MSTSNNQYPSSWAEARRLGTRFYYTGRPCLRGHLAKRLAHSGACTRCVYDSQTRAIRVDMERNPAKHLWLNARKRSKLTGTEFRITIADVEAVWPKNDRCPILGMRLKVNKGKLASDSASLDRIDPKKGYTPSNIAVISYRANRIKQAEDDPNVFRAIANWMDAQKE